MINGNSPISVTISPGQAGAGAPTVTSIVLDQATGALVFTFSDGSQVSAEGLPAALAQYLGGASLAVLDDAGALMLGGKPRLGVSADGNLTMPTPLPDTTTGYVPVSGSGEVYLNGSGPMEVA
ncbi:hypothetical protein [Acidomonas methanolica]|uniref:Mu-like prophage FluMu protein n=1 Tax=Acidomonas methanolica NBRC 104435 TaxID=1231351 RepID=A0A023D795_ACIMT|nr:hypothetical protein [Acidomonas methanolica]MBU2653468.1 hypothetical protein [Acidomonas methanolica]TCS32421.1 hypothetical protein EDC31_101362 [Acidomonas methanolica]GAJ30023.1 Mu-like prophage FluMu protein [Acidomonas methanolica NBRC 104435]GEK97856.1 hypothetical protein AME01nite_03550 [Acidomonas methanolica NBRC 104435]